MFEVDFLPVEAEDGPSKKSGDAIAVRYTDPTGYDRVLVIDAGFTAVGDTVADCIENFYGTSNVDLVISTHPDADHLNGLKRVLERLDVAELLIHRPRQHTRDVSEFANIVAVDGLLATARARGVVVTEPFTGLSRFGASLQVLGPTQSFYERCLVEQLGTAYRTKALLHALLRKSVAVLTDPLKRQLPYLPEETLDESSDTSARNESSVITLIQADGERLLFTGDAGATALDQALDRYEQVVGPLRLFPVDMLHVPHHGSRHNVTPTLLDRLLGAEFSSYGTCMAVVSSAAADLKHPSPQVTNALARRGAIVTATEGRHLCENSGISRPGWTPVAPVPPLREDGI